MNDRSVVVTGTGAVTPCGFGVERLWADVIAGQSPINVIERFPLAGAGTRVAGIVPGYEHELPPYSLSSIFAHAALEEAMLDAGLDAVDLLVVANHGERRAPMPGVATVASTAAGLADDLASASRATQRFAVFGACAAGGLCVAAGLSAIRSGRADAVACLGVDAMVNDFDFFQFVNLYAMSTRDCPPSEASCPFDSRRDGFVLSEGAACLLLESHEHAEARGAELLAVAAGAGISQNAYHMISSPPDAIGPTRAIAAAVADAGIDPSSVDYVNAHGTSTRDNDWCETLSLRRALGDAADGVLVSSTKSVTGHLMAGAGTAEAIIAIKALIHGIAPPTINLHQPDSNCDLDYVAHEARTAEIRHAMSNSFGFGGHNTALVFSRP